MDIPATSGAPIKTQVEYRSRQTLSTINSIGVGGQTSPMLLLPQQTTETNFNCMLSYLSESFQKMFGMRALHELFSGSNKLDQNLNQEPDLINFQKTMHRKTSMAETSNNLALTKR